MVQVMRMARVLCTALLLLTSLSMTSFGASADEAFVADQSFGAPMPVAGEAQPLQAAIASLATGTAPEVKVAGQITEVCQAKGCWMIMVDGDQHARITFKDYGFFVPTETSMQRAVIYGVLEASEISADDAAHYAEDSGDLAKAAQLRAAGKPVREYSLVAAAVQLESRAQ
ncbi:MAG: DUF4920 domain-containing protein [Pseudomonadota bacterium]